MEQTGMLVGNFGLHPKGDHLGVAQAFVTPKGDQIGTWLKEILTPNTTQIRHAMSFNDLKT